MPVHGLDVRCLHIQEENIRVQVVSGPTHDDRRKAPEVDDQVSGNHSFLLRSSISELNSSCDLHSCPGRGRPETFVGACEKRPLSVAKGIGGSGGTGYEASMEVDEDHAGAF